MRRHAPTEAERFAIHFLDSLASDKLATGVAWENISLRPDSLLPHAKIVRDRGSEVDRVIVLAILRLHFRSRNCPRGRVTIEGELGPFCHHSVSQPHACKGN